MGAKVQNYLDMKIIEALKFNSGLLKNLQAAGIRLDDAHYIALYDEFIQMQTNGDKVSYIVAALATKYRISERKVYGLIKKFESDCKTFAAE